MNIALLGNPNCGKTTLFNVLTGASGKVGNWSGVTIEKAVRPLKWDKNVNIIDLPGTYSMNGGSKDRNVVKDYFASTPPDVVINIVDGTNLERNLYLTGELSTLGIPYVIAVNMADELEKNNIKLDTDRLSELFGVFIVKISAKNSMNTDLLIKQALKTTKKGKKIDVFSNGTDGEKYKFLSENLKNIIVKKQTKTQKISDKIDKITTGKYTSLVIFFAVITLVYFLSIKLGGVLGGKVGELFVQLSKSAESSLKNANAPEWFMGFTCGAILKGFGSVLSFLPQVIILFSLMSLLEDSGYLSRVAFVFDGIFSKLGLSGKSLIPLILSSGCTVTGINSTRTIEGEAERKLTIMIAPFMPCSAKSAVFGWLSVVFFNGSAIVATSLYFLSIIICAISGVILRKFKCLHGGGATFFLEIPPYRLPSLKNVLRAISDKVKEFILKAGSIVFSVGLIAWFLQSFGVTGYVGTEIEKSLLYVIGNGIKYIFYPLGFGTWQASVSLASGILAKEAVIETLQIIGADVNTLFNSLPSVYAFMVFIMLSPPCIASLSVAKKELGDKKLFWLMIAYQIVVAYVTAFVINLIGNIFIIANGLLFWISVGIIILTIGIASIKRLLQDRCAYCKNKKGDKLCRKQKRYTI